MTTQAQADALYLKLLNSYIGRKVNPDGAYGMQCKDVADRYAMDLFGVPIFKALAAGNAKSALTGYNPEFFERIPNKVGDLSSKPRLGDIAVFAGNGVNPYGHIALVREATPTQVKLVQQDGFAPPLIYVDGSWYSNKPAHWALLEYDNYGTGPLTHWLRPKLDKIKNAPKVDASTTTKTSTTAKAKAPASTALKRETKATGFQVDRSYYGYPAKPTGITLHHWGVYGQTHDGVVAFLTDTTSAARKANPTSAHAVISDGRVTYLAPWTKATYHSGHTQGNGTTIGLELRPEMTDGDIETTAQVIYEIEREFGSMLIYLHQEFFATACPGKYAAARDRIIKRVNELHAGTQLGSTSKATTAAKPKPKVAPKAAPKAAPKVAAKPAPTTTPERVLTQTRFNVMAEAYYKQQGGKAGTMARAVREAQAAAQKGKK